MFSLCTPARSCVSGNPDGCYHGSALKDLGNLSDPVGEIEDGTAFNEREPLYWGTASFMGPYPSLDRQASL
jgi:hypothetical protein